MAHGSWLMAHGSWLMAHGSWLMAHGSWLIKEASEERKFRDYCWHVDDVAVVCEK